jgi:hypothetical protein
MKKAAIMTDQANSLKGMARFKFIDYYIAQLFLDES